LDETSPFFSESSISRQRYSSIEIERVNSNSFFWIYDIKIYRVPPRGSFSTSIFDHGNRYAPLVESGFFSPLSRFGGRARAGALDRFCLCRCYDSLAGIVRQNEGGKIEGRSRSLRGKSSGVDKRGWHIVGSPGYSSVDIARGSVPAKGRCLI